MNIENSHHNPNVGNSIDNAPRHPDVCSPHEKGDNTHTYSPPFGEIYNNFHGMARDHKSQTEELVKNQILPGTVLNDDIRHKTCDLPPNPNPPQLKPGQSYEGSTEKPKVEGKPFVFHDAKPL